MFSGSIAKELTASPFLDQICRILAAKAHSKVSVYNRKYSYMLIETNACL